SLNIGVELGGFSMPWFAPGPLALPEIFDLNARWLTTKPALTCDDTVWSWAELTDRCRRFAGALQTLGLEPGDRVGVVMDNAPETVVALFGAVYGGFVAVPVNVSVTDAAIAGMLRDSAARAVVCNGNHVARLQAMLGALPELAGRCVAVAPTASWLTFDVLIASATPAAAAAVRPTDECNIIYSSGTTGLPKGIVHDHRCRMAWAQDMAIALRYHPGARTLCTLGLYSNITWVAMLATIIAGGSLFVTRRFDVAACLELIARERITHTVMVPVQLQRVLTHPSHLEANVNSLQSLMCCGSPLPPAIKREVVAYFGGAFMELYGLTEGLVTVLQPEEMATHLESVGKPSPGQHIRILNHDDEPCPPGEAGEIVGRGPLLMAGYHDRPEADAEATWTDRQGQRWLRTGDIGKLDEEGFLYLVDRKKDMIISGGQNIYPADIEAVAIQHSGVAEVAVVGAPSAQWGETPVAFVVGDGEAGDIEAFVNARVGKQQRVSSVVVVPELPRNPNGKVLKRTLREQLPGHA
ncbi:MAG: AMP-binding protein, partial [Pseudomonadota bacterium]